MLNNYKFLLSIIAWSFPQWQGSKGSSVSPPCSSTESTDHDMTSPTRWPPQLAWLEISLAVRTLDQNWRSDSSPMKDWVTSKRPPIVSCGGRPRVGVRQVTLKMFETRHFHLKSDLDMRFKITENILMQFSQIWWWKHKLTPLSVH